MNTGEAIERDGDYFGPAVTKAARLMSLVGGGRVVCSAFTAGLVKVHLTDGLERQCGDLLNECEALRSIALATVGLHPDKAIETCRDALIKLHEIRYWYRIWHIFESIGLSFALTGDVEAASVIVGNLEAHHPPFGYEHILGFRDRTLEIVRRHVQVEEWMARGAVMDRYEIVEYALAALQA